MSLPSPGGGQVHAFHSVTLRMQVQAGFSYRRWGQIHTSSPAQGGAEPVHSFQLQEGPSLCSPCSAKMGSSPCLVPRLKGGAALPSVSRSTRGISPRLVSCSIRWRSPRLSSHFSTGSISCVPPSFREGLSNLDGLPSISRRVQAHAYLPAFPMPPLPLHRGGTSTPPI